MLRQGCLDALFPKSDFFPGEPLSCFKETVASHKNVLTGIDQGQNE